MNVDYIKYGDYYLPALEAPKEKYDICRFGRAYLKYLKQNRRALYSQMMMTGKLLKHVAHIDKLARQMYEDIIRDRIGYAPPRENQMDWVRFMNNLRNSAEEIVYKEFLFEDEHIREEERDR